MVPMRENADPELAKTFLAVLAPGEMKFQFQTFDDNPDRSLKRAKLAWTGYGSLDKYSAWLREANDQSAAVCVTVNQTDGNGRAKKNMVGVRALMLDLDGAPYHHRDLSRPVSRLLARGRTFDRRFRICSARIG
jgi:hypothetical protein